ncbi:unnamed protein product [Schistosoma curassoni]|nr:unnamed protein product [Schistosoma curassoni]
MFSLKWCIIYLINDYLFMNLIKCQLQFNDQLYYYRIDNCESTIELGNWCEWSEWSKCDFMTCTRQRIRECNCPKPLSWTKLTECKTYKPQNDYRINNTIIKHTRHIRVTSNTEMECQIPTIYEGIYYPDCFKLQHKPKNIKYSSHKFKSDYFCTIINNTMEIDLCAKDLTNSQILTKGMREYDIGACDNWLVLHHWNMENLSIQLKHIYDAYSELGRKCSFETDDYYPLCTYYTFYSEYTRSDYGRLNNLAYDIENCRFACAIHLQCKAIEFLYGVHCILAFDFDKSILSQSIGTIIELKPSECNLKIKDDHYIYPYSNAVSVLHV